MPIYLYGCDECGERFERMTTSVSATVDECCPVDGCDGPTKRLPAACRTYMAAHGGISAPPKKPGYDNIAGRRHPSNVRDQGGRV